MSRKAFSPLVISHGGTFEVHSFPSSLTTKRLETSALKTRSRVLKLMLVLQEPA